MKHELTEMTEHEINNFAYILIIVINQKNQIIYEQKAYIKELEDRIRTTEAVKLTKEEIIRITRPVWVVPANSHLKGFYALPITGGVINNKNGRYTLDNYEKTWVAYSERPIK